MFKCSKLRVRKLLLSLNHVVIVVTMTTNVRKLGSYMNYNFFFYFNPLTHWFYLLFGRQLTFLSMILTDDENDQYYNVITISANSSTTGVKNTSFQPPSWPAAHAEPAAVVCRAAVNTRCQVSVSSNTCCDRSDRVSAAPSLHIGGVFKMLYVYIISRRVASTK